MENLPDIAARARGPARSLDERETARKGGVHAVRRNSLAARPFRLLGDPQPIEVASVIPDGPPIRMVWQDQIVAWSDPGGRSGSPRAGGERRTSSATITAPSGRMGRTSGSFATSASAAGSCTASSSDSHARPDHLQALRAGTGRRSSGPNGRRRSDTSSSIARRTSRSSKGHRIPMSSSPGGRSWATPAGHHRSKQRGRAWSGPSRRQGGRPQADSSAPRSPWPMRGPVLLWVMNRAGYGRLCRLLTRGRRQAAEGGVPISTSRTSPSTRSGLLVGALLPRGRRDSPRFSPPGATSFPIGRTRWPSCIAGLRRAPIGAMAARGARDCACR